MALTGAMLSECCQAPVEAMRLADTVWYECSACGAVL